MRTRPAAYVRALMALLALAFGTLSAAPDVAGAQTNPYHRGPAPTPAIPDAPTRPFATRPAVVPRQSTWAGGTITYPTDTSQGTFGAAVVSPGFLSPQVALAGPRIASNGFVVLTIDT